MKSLIFLFLILNVSAGFSKTFNLGIVSDYSQEESSEIINLIKNSLSVVLNNPDSVVISPKNILIGKNDIPTILENFEKVMGEKKLNLVIALGPASSYKAALTKELKRPVIATHLFDRSLAKKKNLAALKLYPSLEEVKIHFQEINVGKNILVVSQDKEVLNTYLNQIPLVLGENYNVSFYKTSKPIDPEILKDINLVFYTPKPFENAADFPAFQKMVNEKKILSYSISGTDDFKNGVLIAPEVTNFNERLSRVIALSVMEVKQGKSTESLEKDFISFKKITANRDVEKEFVLNVENLSFLGVGGSQATQNSIFPKLTLMDAVNKTIGQNYSYQASKLAFEQSEYQAKSAFTKFFPQIGLEGVSDLYKDPDGLLLTRSKDEISAINLNLRQFVFSDDTLARYDISKYSKDKYLYKNDDTKIEVIASTVEKYLDTLNLSSIVKIREENLAFTLENLQIAQLNFKTGKSSKFEVYRWESQAADNKKDLAGANFEFKRSLHELNRLMNEDLSLYYNLDDYEIINKVLMDDEVHLPSKYQSMDLLEKYISFVIEESKASYPLLKEVEQDVKIAERELLNKDRAFFLPKLEIFSDYYSFLGSNPFEGTAQPDDFRIGIRLTFPLFESLNKFYERSAEVKKLGYAQTSKRNVYQQVEKLLRDQVVGIRTSFDQVKYEVERQSAAKANMDLIRLAYKTGKVDILFLLDAQNFYLKASEGVVISKNNFLLELTRLERRMGQFNFLRTPAEQNEFHERYRKYMGLKSN